MTDFLPMFPLKLVAFPEEELNLHIFEPRYKQLIRECEQNGTTFGIPVYLGNKVMDFGTEVEVTEVTKKNEDGSMDIKTRGVGIFKIHEFYSVVSNKLYAGADIERVSGSADSDYLLKEKIVENLEILFDYLSISKNIPQDKSDFSTYEIAHHSGLSIEQEYEMLTISDEIKRQQFLLNHLYQLIPVVKEMEKLRQRATMNGHFKNVIPPI